MTYQNKIYQNVDVLINHFVQEGMYIHIAATMSRPNALIYSLARNFKDKKKSLVISMAALHGAAHALTLSGSVRKMITGFVGDTYPYPRPQSLYKELEFANPFEIEHCSLLTLVQRLKASAFHLPYAITNSLVGSNLSKNKNVFFVQDPMVKDKKITLLKPLTPDITLVHGVCADREGNIIIVPPLGEGAWGALAAKKGVIASVEKIVDVDVIRNNSNYVLIPAHKVLGICEARFGAHPQSLRTNEIAGINGYLDDYSYLNYISKIVKKTSDAYKWFEEWVDLSTGHDQYLEKLKEFKKENLDEVLIERSINEQPSDSEILIALAAREIERKVLSKGYKTLLAGIGHAHIASWLAATNLEKKGYKIKLMSEMGFYGYTPSIGDTYLFSQLHANNCVQTTSITEVLGNYVSDPREKALAVIGTGEIDENCNINTTLSRDNHFIVGSGGANDISSTSDTLVVTHLGKRRLVKKVKYITSPGKNVVGIITPIGIIKKDNKGLSIKSMLQGYNPKLLKKCTENWDFYTGNYVYEKPLSKEERTLIHQLDPKGVFL